MAETAMESRRTSLFLGFDITTEDIFLDVGCGSGGICQTAAGVGADVIAVDIVPDHVTAATAAVEGMGARSYRGIVSDCDPIPLPDGTASAIVCLEVMEHVANPERFIKELARVGKPGARYALSVPSAASESLMKILAPASYFQPPEHLRIFEREQFESLVRSAGLEIDHSMGIGFYSTIWWTLRMASGTSHCPDHSSPPPQILASWEETWKALLLTPHGQHVAQVLDELIPKSLVVVAHKPVSRRNPLVRFLKQVFAR